MNVLLSKTWPRVFLSALKIVLYKHCDEVRKKRQRRQEEVEVRNKGEKETEMSKERWVEEQIWEFKYKKQNKNDT